jgi:hypothetical protein
VALFKKLTPSLKKININIGNPEDTFKKIDVKNQGEISF